MSNFTKTVLVASVFVALLVMVVATWLTRVKIKQIAQKHSQKSDKVGSPPELRQNAGELLWDLKKRTTNALDDVQMEMILATVKRNNFQKTLVVSRSSYIQKTLEKLGKQKVVKTGFNCAVVETTETLNSDFDKVYKKLPPKKGMIIVVNLKNHRKEAKKLKNYLKLSSIRHDYEPIGQGMMFVVKQE